MSVTLLPLLLRALAETLLMVFVSGAVAFALGIPTGVALYVTSPGRLLPRPWLNRILGGIVNLGRSVPFIILLVAVIPLTRFLTGTSIGVWAAIVPLGIGAVPFMARLVEGALLEIPTSLVEAAGVLGASPWHIIVRVLVPEAAPGIVHGSTVTLVSLVNYSAMAGAVGGGGLGDVGIRHGYQRFDPVVMVVVVVVLVAIVQGIQFLGTRVGQRLDRRSQTLL